MKYNEYDAPRCEVINLKKPFQLLESFSASVEADDFLDGGLLDTEDFYDPNVL